MPIKYAGKITSLLVIAASPPTPSRKRKTSLFSGSLTPVPIFLKNHGTSSGRMINRNRHSDEQQPPIVNGKDQAKCEAFAMLVLEFQTARAVAMQRDFFIDSPVDHERRDQVGM